MNEGFWIMPSSILLLMLCSVFLGFLFSDFFLCIAYPNLDKGYSTMINLMTMSDIEYIEKSNIYHHMPLILGLSGILIYVFTYNYLWDLRNSISLNIIRHIYFFFIGRWYFDILYNRLIVLPFLTFGHWFISFNIDRGLFEIFSVFFSFNCLMVLRSNINQIGFSTGFLNYYLILSIILSVVFCCILGWFSFFVVLYSLL
jgi:hypothetical protein